MPDAKDVRDLYLDLMKRCLIDSIFLDDPLANFVLHREKPQTPQWKRHAIRVLKRFLEHYRLRLVEPHSVPWEAHNERSEAELMELRRRGLGWPARAHTLIGVERLNNIQLCVESVLRDNVPGDLIETGVWRGGACIFMRAILKAYGDETRNVWLADSFEGLPPPNTTDYPAGAGGRHHVWSEVFAVTRENVEENFRQYDLLDDRVRFLVGWFKDTLPGAPIDKLAVLRLDGDMYEATWQALDSLYDKLSPGGYVIVDDYYLAPCAKAVHDFRDRRAITDEMIDIEGRSVYWRRR